METKGCREGLRLLLLLHALIPCVEYFETHAPVSGSVNINIKCVDNVFFFLVVHKSHVIVWGPENPVCMCCPGYKERQGEYVMRRLM